jgi:ornithine cyclodeaminase
LAGVKWIASFPANYERGLDRASAVIVLNSTDTGIPEVILEGSIISAKRTAASAALAARTLITGAPPSSVGIIGCGLINAEILRFLGALFPLERLVMLDTDLERMSRFRERIRSFLPDIRMSVAAHAAAVFRAASLISIATTASAPHIESIDRPVTILHVSLRDLSVSSILASDNVVDDPDHVCRARTSLHLAEEATGRRDFIRCTLGEILCGKKPARRDEGSVIFSPFGLGILDLAVARLVCDLALRSGVGTRIEGFLPEPWLADRG